MRRGGAAGGAARLRQLWWRKTAGEGGLGGAPEVVYRCWWIGAVRGGVRREKFCDFFVVSISDFKAHFLCAFIGKGLETKMQVVDDEWWFTIGEVGVRNKEGSRGRNREVGCRLCEGLGS